MFLQELLHGSGGSKGHMESIQERMGQDYEYLNVLKQLRTPQQLT